MTFEQAMATVKAGTNVRRSSWTGRHLQKQVRTDDKTVIDTVIVRTTRAPYTATQEDIVATDWTT